MSNRTMTPLKEKQTVIQRQIKKNIPVLIQYLLNKRSHIVWAIGPVLSFFLMEYMIGNISFTPFSLRLSGLQIVLNLIWYYMFAGALFLLIGRRNLSAGISASLLWFIGNIEHYVYQFRWRVIFPADLMAAGTALNVVDNYDLKPSTEQITAVLLLLVYIILLFFVPRQKKYKLPRPLISLSLIGLSFIYIFVFFSTPFLYSIGMGNEMRESMWDTKKNGILLNFIINMRNLRVEQPEGYSLDTVRSLADEADASEDVSNSDPAATGKTKPNVIVIMNEAFTDLSVLGNVETNADCMPFIHSLKENTITGNVYTSVFGGHTASSEYEFITGNTMAFLPGGTVAYQMYVKDGDYNLGAQLQSLGYKTTFMHPYFSTGWNRRNVYRSFGYDEVLFKNNFWGTQYIRDYVSDKSNYRTLIRAFENNTGDNPSFIFNVTMQNHGAYSSERNNLERTVYLTGEFEGKYAHVDTYLSLVRESDAAFENLVSYFREVDEPTILLMFGDHQPNLGDAFYEDVFGKKQDRLTLEETAIKYKVPFVIWANYDIEEQSGLETSINFLSPLLLKTAGLPLTGYQKFLSHVSENVPILTYINFRENNGTFTNQMTDLSEESQKLLADYQILQYNGIFDRKDRLDKLFYLEN